MNDQNRARAIEIIRSSNLADRADRIVAQLEPGMRLRATRNPGASSAVVSRFAGNGMLPRNVEWPTWNSAAFHRKWKAYCERKLSGKVRSSHQLQSEIERYEAMALDNPKPLDFLAMIRLGDIAPHSSLLGLPDHGALLFFYDIERSQGSFWPEARGAWQVLYAEDENDLVTVHHAPKSPPSEPVPSILSLELAYTLPEDIRDASRDEDLSVYSSEEYERIHSLLLGLTNRDHSEVIHQLGGAPQEVQQDLFYQCQLASNGIDCGDPDDRNDEQVKALAVGAKDWRLILQIDSDEEAPGWMWGDAGRLYYCLHKDDLAARRFDRAWCSEQCG